MRHTRVTEGAHIVWLASTLRFYCRFSLGDARVMISTNDIIDQSSKKNEFDGVDEIDSYRKDGQNRVAVCAQ